MTIIGALCGGTFVDAELLSYLDEYFGEDWVTKIQKEKLSDYLKLMKNWEELKQGFDGEDNVELTLEVPGKGLFTFLCPCMVSHFPFRLYTFIFLASSVLL